ncbi:hypothetical protein KCV01_g19264, partial [Aureobasidium melanogenum]
DVRMPGMDGFALCRLLQELPPERQCPILFLTSADSPGERLEGLTHGGVDYILKTCAPDELLARVRIHLRLAQRHEAPRTPEETTAVSPDEVVLRAAMRLIGRRLGESFSLEEIAADVGTYDKRLSAIFRQRLGMTVFAWIREERLRRGRELLADTALGMQEIAEHIGFRSATARHRARKRMKPERFRGWRVVGAVLSLCLWSVVARAAVQLPLTAYDQSHGLDSLSIVRLAQDRDGFVWAGTEKGLYRFDGVAFTAVGADEGFQTSEVIGFAEDNTRHVWVASRAGIQRRADDGRFEWVRPQGQPLLADRGQTLVARDDGDMLVISGHRLLRLFRDTSNAWHAVPLFDAARMKSERGLDQVTAVFHRAGVTWFGCGEALCRLDAGKLTRFDAARGVPSDRWLGFLSARDGSLWARGIHGIRRLAPGAKAFESRDMPEGHTRVTASSLDLVEDSEGRIVTRSDTGLGRWDGRRWERFDTTNGLPGVGVSVLMADRDGMVWMGTYGRGVFYWSSADAVENWTSAQGLDDSLIWSIARADRRSIWVAGESGGEVIVPTEGRAHRWPLDVPAPTQAHAVLVDRKGRPWYFLFDGRVVRYETDTRRTVPVTTLPYLVRGAFIDRQGGIWAYTLGGAYAIDPDSGAATRVAPGLIPTTMCSDMAEDPDERLWLACSTGLYRHDARGWSRVAVRPEDAAGGYENVAVTPDGKLWLSSLQPGLLVGEVTDASAVTLEAVADPLLADTRFYFLRPDRDGRLWAGGGNGVDVLDNERWTRLSVRDGLLWDETNHGAFFADDDGTVWIGAPVGMTHV